MRAVLSYLVTKSVLGRFEKTVEFQKKFFPEAINGLDKVVITDHETPVRTDWPVIRADIRVKGLFNQSKAKNVAFEYATTNGYDWFFDGDADRVLINLPSELPMPGLAALPIYYAKEGEDEQTIFDRWKVGSLEFVGSSFFLLHREVFSCLRACEEYVVNRFDDVDFVFNVCQPNGVKTVHVDAKAIHLWHSDAERAFNHQEHNRIVYERRRKEKGGLGPPA